MCIESNDKRIHWTDEVHHTGSLTEALIKADAVKETGKIEEAPEVIHVQEDKNAPPEILDAGKFYKLNGTVFKAEARPESSDPCDGCVFDGLSGPATCGLVDCDKNDVRLIPEDGKSRGCSECKLYQKWPPNVVKERGSYYIGECPNGYGPVKDEKKALTCPKFERFSPPGKCAKCGHNPGTLYHVSCEKALCEYCIENGDNMKKFRKFLEDMPPGKSFEFRAQFGYGCTTDCMETTCFRINKNPGGYASWGTNHYKIGDYKTPGTPAHKWAAYLKEIGGVEA